MKWLGLVLPLVLALLFAADGNARQRLRDRIESFPTPRAEVPAGWPAPRYDFTGNPVTASGFELGRRLFYDPRLSRDGSISCASCHQQFAAFAHLDHRVSHGLHGANGTRNAPALFNLAWQPELMWDGAIRNLELQPLAPLANPVEMGETMDGVLAKLRADAGYRRRFEAAFGPGEIDSRRVLLALTQFIGMLRSADSRYDAALRGGPALTEQENAGLALFRERCASCHREPLFTDFSYRGNGLDTDSADAGRAVISGSAADRGRFKVPSLRNVGVSSPYMHDGRFDTLQQVLRHYAAGIRDSAALDPALRGGLKLDAAQQQALVAFLESLSDTAFLDDARYAEPAP
ncbi:cytochrome-c peroxidase [Solimonas sp. K1W22B-7]|uniref:cytochrome-c peroxidase n=1 Tax=Solimonas sp. K1W22B-7 TaxID=2303331 RepID=UPI000E33795E|nr:cytochrome c peroxidase [Solimonas sp. K1W22B-7]AXQ31293.1 cytochrome-c peroxidase [Solimonas sp. K1W22B-7]